MSCTKNAPTVFGVSNWHYYAPPVPYSGKFMYKQKILATPWVVQKMVQPFFRVSNGSFYHSPQQRMLRIAEVPFSMYVLYMYSTINPGERSLKKKFLKKMRIFFLINPSSNAVVPNFLGFKKEVNLTISSAPFSLRNYASC